MENERAQPQSNQQSDVGFEDDYIQQLKFEVDPAVIFQLGEQLVSDDITALLELVKNAYDADSDWVKIRVDPDFIDPDNPEAMGRIVVEDGGNGMGFGEIKNGWLLISNSLKRAMKEKGEFTPKGRTPLGDKGLGRLGVQRLGRFCTLETCPSRDGKAAAPFGYQVRVDWEEFRKARTLSLVPFQKRRIPPRIGTSITVSGLRSLDSWRDRTSFETLRRKLSQLLFPFSVRRPFQVYGEINGWRLDLDELAERQLNQATLRFRFSFDGSTLSFAGRYRLNYLFRRGTRGSDTERQQFESLIEPDQGADFFAYMAEKRAVADLGMEFMGNDGWLCTVSVSKSLRDIDKLTLLEGQPANPGPFTGEVAEFALQDDSDLDPSVFDDRSEYIDFVKRNYGIRVFRDGFGVRPYGFEGDDWLDLKTQQTSGSSFYSLRPANTIGFVNISARDNGQLEEKTDREGFSENAFFANFKRLMESVISSINRANGLIRRTYTEYQHEKARQDAGLQPSDQTVDSLNERVGVTLQSASNLGTRAARTQQRLEQATKKSESAQERLDGAMKTGAYIASPEVTEAMKRAGEVLAETQQLLQEAVGLTGELKAHLVALEEVKKTTSLMKDEYFLLKSRLEQLTTLAGLGLSAELISHDLFDTLDRLGDQTRAVTKLDVGKDPRLASYFSHVRSTISTLRKQVSRLNPELQYVREERTVLQVSTYLEEAISDHYCSRLEKNGATVHVEVRRDFRVDINQGRLDQVFDNLLGNSGYWLAEALRTKRIDEAKVHIVVDSPLITIWDTGVGVDPDVQSTLFDPFITTKPKGKGRGLGLFITRQLLDFYGCSISLRPEKNGFGRRYMFQVDLSEVCLSAH